MEEQKKRKKIIVIVIGLALLLGTSILGIKYWLSEKKMAFVAEQVELGQRYLTEMNYEEAIVAFTKAIEAEPRSVESYLGLSAAYEGQGNYEEAMAILEKGFSITEDIRLSERLEYLRVLLVYMEFLNTKGYEKYLSQTPSGYALIDINQDGVEELVFETLLDPKEGIPWQSFHYDFFYYDFSSGQICYTNESHNGVGLYQSIQYAAAVFLYANTRGGSYYYHGISDGELIDMFYLLHIREEGGGVTYLDGEELPESAYEAYMDELTKVEFLPLPGRP